MLRGEIPGFIHLSTGQEAVPAAVCALLEPADLVGATHRGDGQCLAEVKGVYPIGELLAVIDVPGAA